MIQIYSDEHLSGLRTLIDASMVAARLLNEQGKSKEARNLILAATSVIHEYLGTIEHDRTKD